MARITKDHITGTLLNLTHQARKAGLMTDDQRLLYSEGVASGGVPPRVWLDREGTHCPFLPTFEMLTKAEQYRTIQGALNALMAVNSRR